MRCPIALFVLLSLLPHPAMADSYAYAPESIGKVMVGVEKGSYRGYYRLSPAESAAYEQSLQRILNVPLSMPHLKPPVGVTLKGWLRSWHSPQCPGEPCLGVPVVGQGCIFYHYHLVIDGKGVPCSETPFVLDISLNNLEEAMGRAVDDVLRDPVGRRLRYQPKPVGELDGLPVFEPDGSGTLLLVLAREGRPWWKPVSQETFLQAAIRELEKQVAALPPTTDTPAAELYGKWTAERPKRQAEALRQHEELKQRNPALAETLRQTNEKLERDLTEKFREDLEIEKAKAVRSGPKPKVLTLQDRLDRHRAVLAGMPREDRARQAFYYDAKDPLEPPLGSAERGQPMAVFEPAYFDSSLPRTSIQLLVIRFGSNLMGPLPPGGPGGLNPGYRALWRSLHETPWSRLKEILVR
jgi:hypothetical protein